MNIDIILRYKWLREDKPTANIVKEMRGSFVFIQVKKLFTQDESTINRGKPKGRGQKSHQFPFGCKQSTQASTWQTEEKEQQVGIQEYLTDSKDRSIAGPQEKWEQGTENHWEWRAEVAILRVVLGPRVPGHPFLSLHCGSLLISRTVFPTVSLHLPAPDLVGLQIYPHTEAVLHSHLLPRQWWPGDLSRTRPFPGPSVLFWWECRLLISSHFLI